METTKGLVIVAVGLPGAGKSRFHEKFLPDAVRCCQDLLKRREILPPHQKRSKTDVVDLTAED